MSNLLWNNSDWTFDDINRIYTACEDIALNELGLNCYPNQIEVISSTQMIDAYTSVGMPIYYNHWSFGKQFVQEQRSYSQGKSGLAFEIVINSSPCINYIMEDNTTTTQALVIAHAAFGHNHFFKNNYLFREWTDASGIVDYLIFAKQYVAECETKYGARSVETWLDSCHALQDHGVNRYRRPTKLNMDKERQRQKEREEYQQSQVSELYRIIPSNNKSITQLTDGKIKGFPAQPEENLLYFFEKYSPDIEPWQRELLRIVRKMAHYFYPQRRTKVMNEGFASLTHYQIMNRLHEKGLITDGAYLEFIALHSSVLFQPDFDHPGYTGHNPYALGFAMLRDIQRMCKTPTEEDLKWFPQIAGANSQELILDTIANHSDESFIRQWLSPHVIRKLKLFSVHDDRSDTAKYSVTTIHNDAGYQDLRHKLADQYLTSTHTPLLEVVEVDRKTRACTIRYTSENNRQLGNIAKMMPHLSKLWGRYPIKIVDQGGDVLDSME